MTFLPSITAHSESDNTDDTSECGYDTDQLWKMYDEIVARKCKKYDKIVAKRRTKLSGSGIEYDMIDGMSIYSAALPNKDAMIAASITVANESTCSDLTMPSEITPSRRTRSSSQSLSVSSIVTSKITEKDKQQAKHLH